MSTARLEAFSDGVIAIIITIMVLELKVPHDANPAVLLPLLPILLSYLLSFIIVAIYWVNHHHLLHLARRADAPIMWANMNLLFWMSLMPWVTGYMGVNRATPLSVALYTGVALASSIAFYLLRSAIARHHKHDAALAALHPRLAKKNILASALYAAAIPLAWVSTWLALALVALPALMYFLPDRRVEAVQKGAVQ
jgi:uncharacterized membrane protein